MVNNKTKETRVQVIKIHHDILPKYCQTYKLQVHEEDDCISLHPELQMKKMEDKHEGEGNNIMDQNNTMA